MDREEVMKQPRWRRRLAIRNRRGRYLGSVTYLGDWHRRQWASIEKRKGTDREYSVALQRVVGFLSHGYPSKRDGWRFRKPSRLNRRLRRSWFYGEGAPMGQRDFRRWLEYQADNQQRARGEVVRQALQRARIKGKRVHLRYERAGGNWRNLLDEC